AYRVPDATGWVDIRGRPRTPGSDREGSVHLAPIVRRGEELAVIACDPALSRQRPLLDSVVAAAGLAVDNAHLYASLQVQLKKVQASGQRLAQATIDERRRIQRDLHDGAQQQLLAVLMALDRARYGLVPDDDPRLATVLTDIQKAHDQLELAVTGLRDLIQAI